MNEVNPKAIAPKPEEGKSDTKGSLILGILVMPLMLLYQELIFRLSTLGPVFDASLVHVGLFSFVYGLLGFFLTSLLKSRKANAILKLVLMSLSAVVFLIGYFVFRQFKVYYDLRTIFKGAGDVAGGFLEETLALIFSPGGLLRIAFYALPLVLYGLFWKKLDGALVANGKSRLAALALLLLSSVGLVISIESQKGVKNTYTKQYSFPAAVEEFGYLTALKLDLKDILFDSGGSFASHTHESAGDYRDYAAQIAAEMDQSKEESASSIEPSEASGSSEASEGAAASPSSSPASDSSEGSISSPEGGAEDESKEESSAEPVEYGLSMLDIDFASLPDDGAAIRELDEYVQTVVPSSKNAYTGLFQGMNLIFLSAEAFSAEAIDPVYTPTLYRMATKGMQFLDYYQPAGSGTIGGEFQNIFGLLSVDGGATFEEQVGKNNYYTLGSFLDREGYFGIAYHNNDYTYYSRHRTHNAIGYSEGFYGYGNGVEKYVEPTWPESDLLMIQGTLWEYIAHRPFNAYYMTVSGHSNYYYNANDMSRKNWAAVEDMDATEPIKGYIACNIELDKAMEYLIETLEMAGLADETVIVISADHFPYGLDDDAPLGQMPYLTELYGYEPTTYLERDHNRLLIWSGLLEKREPIVVKTPVCSIDILPTLCNLFGVEWDSRLLPGRDVFSDREAVVFNLSYDWKTVLGTYTARNGHFEAAAPGIIVPEGYIEYINDVVADKIRYCKGIVRNDYYEHLSSELPQGVRKEESGQ